jgi:hypothetical protein
MRRGLVAGAVALALITPPAAQAQATPPGGGAETGTVPEQTETGNLCLSLHDRSGWRSPLSHRRNHCAFSQTAKVTESHTGTFRESSFTNTTVFNGLVAVGEPGTNETGHLNTHQNGNKTGHANFQCNDSQGVTFCP